MTKKKKIYHNKITFNIFSESPIPNHLISDLLSKANENNCIGGITKQNMKIVIGRKAAKMMICMGLNPMLLQMNEFGNETGE